MSGFAKGFVLKSGTPVALTPEQGEQVLKLHAQGKSLREITQTVFGDATLDGRTNEGKGVRIFLANEGITDVKTSGSVVGPMPLTPEQRQYIDDHYKEGIPVMEMAKTLFPEAKLSIGCREVRAVIFRIREIDPRHAETMRDAAEIEYVPPTMDEDICKKIASYANRYIDHRKPTTHEKKCIEFVRHNLSSYRFVTMIEQMNSMQYRNIFESEFVKAIHDKPDLTSDEVNLYLNLASQFVHLNDATKRCQILSDKFAKHSDNDQAGNRELTMTFAELHKVASAERDALSKSIESLTKKLNGDRSARLKQQGERTVSLTAVMDAFRNQEERRNMLRIADMQREAIKQNIEELEGMDSFKARIMGVRKELFI